MLGCMGMGGNTECNAEMIRSRVRQTLVWVRMVGFDHGIIMVAESMLGYWW